MLTTAVVGLRPVGFRYCVGVVDNVVRTPHSRESLVGISLVCHKVRRLLADQTIEVVPRPFQMLNLDWIAGWSSAQYRRSTAHVAVDRLRHLAGWVKILYVLQVCFP